MKKLSLALALVGAAGLVTACGGDSGDSAGTPPEKPADDSALTQPVKKAEEVAGDLQEKAAEAGEAMAAERTVQLTISGMS